MSAFRRAVAECLIKVQQLVELRSAHDIHDAFIIDRSVFVKSIGAVIFEFVREVSAGDKQDPPVQALRRLPDLASQPIVIRQGQTRKSDADDPVICRIHIAVEKIEGDHGPVIQFRIPLSHGACRKFIPVAKSAQRMDKLIVVAGTDRNIPCAESSEIALRIDTRGDMKIITIHHTVGRCDHHRLRIQRGRKGHCL